MFPTKILGVGCPNIVRAGEKEPVEESLEFYEAIKQYCCEHWRTLLNNKMLAALTIYGSSLALTFAQNESW